MNEEVEMLLEDSEDQMKKAIIHFENELLKIRAGKASPTMLDGIFVEYYGTNSALKNIASVNTPDARTLVIQPFEKTLLSTIEKAILAANIGLTPHNDGIIIRINVPALTEERRRDLVKQAKGEAEHCKVSIRTIRREANEYIRKMTKDGLSEDIAKNAEALIQQLTDGYSAKSEKHLEVKEREILTI